MFNLYRNSFNKVQAVERKRSKMKARKNVKKNSRAKTRKTVKRGHGLLDKIIDRLPFEMHLPKYQYCGPGTKLAERLARGDKGINKLDELCKEHDIAYATYKNSDERYVADKKLGSEAIKRVFSKDAKLGERAASLLVSAAMKAKTSLAKLGKGLPKLKCRKKPKKSKIAKTIAFKTLVKNADKCIRRLDFFPGIDNRVHAAIQEAKKSVKGKDVKVPRIIKVPTYTGGILPIIPILVGLSAVGSLVSSVTNVVKTAKEINRAGREQRSTELKVGNGLYLRPYSKGSGLYLSPNSKNY